MRTQRWLSRERLGRKWATARRRTLPLPQNRGEPLRLIDHHNTLWLQPDVALMYDHITATNDEAGKPRW